MNPEPLIDCVADMQVIYRLDTNNDGTIDSTVNDISGLTAQQIRDRVKEVRVYILSHEGQSDRSFRYRNSTITIGEFGLGRTFNLSSTIGRLGKLPLESEYPCSKTKEPCKLKGSLNVKNFLEKKVLR